MTNTNDRDDTPISLPREELASYCRRNGIRKLSLFGSVLRGSAGPDSDLDLLVEFEPGIEALSLQESQVQSAAAE